RQHFLNFLPLPHGQGSLRPTFLKGLIAWSGFHSEWPVARVSSSWSVPASNAQVENLSTMSPNGECPLRNHAGPFGDCNVAFRSSSKSSKLSDVGSTQPRSNACLTCGCNSTSPNAAIALCQPSQTQQLLA